MHSLFAAASAPWFGSHEIDLKIMILFWAFSPVITILVLVGIGKSIEFLVSLFQRSQPTKQK